MRTKYRIQKTIDVTLTQDGDGEFPVEDVVGGYLNSYPTVTDLRDAGFTVTEVDDRPLHQKDPIGTVRRFNFSGNRVIKTSNGWFYLEVRDENGARKTRGPGGRFVSTVGDDWTDNTTVDTL